VNLGHTTAPTYKASDIRSPLEDLDGALFPGEMSSWLAVLIRP